MWRKTIQIIIQSDLERWKNLKNGIFYLKKKNKKQNKQTIKQIWIFQLFLSNINNFQTDLFDK